MMTWFYSLTLLSYFRLLVFAWPRLTDQKALSTLLSYTHPASPTQVHFAGRQSLMDLQPPFILAFVCAPCICLSHCTYILL